jgi:choline dehydrogenase
VDLPGVGRNLHDHPSVYLQFSGTARLVEELEAFARRGNTLVAEQSLAKLRSAGCSTAFDLHTFPIGGHAALDRSLWEFVFPVANMVPHSRGQVTLRDAAPTSAPRIDTGYLTDPADADLDVLLNGVEIARDMTRQAPLRDRLGAELPATAQITDAEAVRRNCLHYYHPVGTCKMGSAADPLAVVDGRGRVHGFEQLYVADASVMPVIPRANTYIPTLVVAERIVGMLM